MLLTITEFIGRFHPLLVHLPIGILLLALLLQWLFRKEEASLSHGIMKAIWCLGIGSALLSCITGYLLSLQGGYDENTVALHMWMGLAVAALSMFIGARVFTRRFDIVYKGASVVLLLLIAATGHFGGTLTHGEDYLLSALGDEETPAVAAPIPVIPNVQEAAIYADVVKPIFETRCYSCHGAKKQKGKLRMDSPEALLKGGKNGEVIIPEEPGESEMIQRLLLPLGDEHHMPPKGKPKLTKDQIALLHWWIAGGASFDKKVKDLAQAEKIKPVLAALERAPQEETKATPIVPESAVAAADPRAIEALRNKGVIVVPVAQNSNYLSVNFVTATGITDKEIQLLLPLKQQLLWIKLSDKKIGDEAMKYIKECNRLRLLHLSNTGITDSGLALLTSLKELRSLNLVSTKVSANGLLSLKGLTHLEAIYLYKTNVDKTRWRELKASFPATMLDTGGYAVPILASDTTEFKKEIK